MAKKKKTKKRSSIKDISMPSELELQVLGVLWKHGRCTAREVLENLSDGKDRAYTSVLSVMQVMEKKELIAQTGERRKLANVYHSKVSKRQIMGPMFKGIVEKVFGGSGIDAAMQLMSQSKVSNDELDEMEAWIEAARKRKQKRKS